METRRRQRGIGARVAAAAGASLIALGLLAAPAAAVVPSDGGALLSLLPVTINDDSGDQYDPHVSGDLVSYTSGATIGYYDFFSGNDFVVPPEVGASDHLSDVSIGRIAFTRLDASFTASARVFDTVSMSLTEMDPQTGSIRQNSAIGSDTVAFIDRGLNAEGELLISVISGTTVRVTNDGAFDDHPQVAPLGDLVVYESCPTLPNCDIHQAAWVANSWVVTELTSTAEREANPDSDGSLVVYDATRSGERDIFWQPVGGGPELQLELAGEQLNPSISEGIIAFESVPPGGGPADLWLYRVETNTLFRITSTFSDESLNDVSVLNDGRIRTVWTAGPVGTRDVYGATIELPPVGPNFDFGGLMAPVDPLPTLNSMKAGAAVPVKFSLGGDFGLDIFATGYPKSQVVACDSTAPVDGVEQTLAAGGSGLTYNPTSDSYSYVWKTDKAWAGTCRQLVLSFADGTVARANFKFK